jgi:hypothetical protein
VKLGWYESGARLVRAVELLLPPYLPVEESLGGADDDSDTGPTLRWPTMAGPVPMAAMSRLAGIN